MPLVGLQLLCRVPTFFKLLGADIAQPRTQSAAVVERQPVNHFIHRLSSEAKSLPIWPAHFQSTPHALRGHVLAVAFSAKANS